MNPLFRNRFYNSPIGPPISVLGRPQLSGLLRDVSYYFDKTTLPMDCLLSFILDMYKERGVEGLSTLLRLNEAFVTSQFDDPLITRTNGKILFSPLAATQRAKNGVSAFAAAFANSSESAQRSILLSSLIRCIQTQPEYLVEFQLAFHRHAIIVKQTLKEQDDLESLCYRGVPLPHSLLITPTRAVLTKTDIPWDLTQQATQFIGRLRGS